MSWLALTAWWSEQPAWEEERPKRMANTFDGKIWVLFQRRCLIYSCFSYHGDPTPPPSKDVDGERENHPQRALPSLPGSPSTDYLLLLLQLPPRYQPFYLKRPPTVDYEARRQGGVYTTSGGGDNNNNSTSTTPTPTAVVASMRFRQAHYIITYEEVEPVQLLSLLEATGKYMAVC